MPRAADDDDFIPDEDHTASVDDLFDSHMQDFEEPYAVHALRACGQPCNPASGRRRRCTKMQRMAVLLAAAQARLL
jgi:hypothetical protein